MTDDSLVPVTLLCGFLGSGKTTLLKHILENKHSDEDFNCAVIVNDMAELNIDKSLIDQTSLIQSDDAMVGMQNGCICCTLQSDLCDQIVKLTQMKKFNYILIEASGVSEPHEIAPLFEVHPHYHMDHADEEDHDHETPQLGEVARLDTCVTLIDSADFYNNLGSMKAFDDCGLDGTIAELMMDQVEFANIVILNKGDLVNEGQQSDLTAKVELLNPNARIVKTVQSKIDVKEILNTRLYKDKDEFWVTSAKRADAAAAEERKVEVEGGKRQPEACTARFDIKSFVYRARRPFHPARLNDLVVEPYFSVPIFPSCEHENSKEEVEQNKLKFKELQEEALEKQTRRKEKMGEVLRSKGFFWIATTNDIIGGWQQAGNVIRIASESPWLCLLPEIWEGTKSEAHVTKDFKKPDGEEWEYKDRRQEIVFIGHGMKKDVIQELLDRCLLTDEEMAMGPKEWKKNWADLDRFKLVLDESDDEDEEESDDDEPDSDGEKETKRMRMTDGRNDIKRMKISQ